VNAAVWIVGGPALDDRSDLRYSLRSVAANCPSITEAWVIGDVPGWFTGVKMPLPPHPEKFANQRASLTAFVNHPGAPERFVLANDDMYVIEPAPAHLPAYRNKNPLSGWVDAERSERRLNAWHRAVIATAEWVADKTGTDPYIYECHVPLMFHTATFRDLINAYPADRPFAAGELYPLAGCGAAAGHAGNAKCGKADSLAAKLANPMPFLSSSPDTWPGVVADHVKPLFPDPSPWEV